MLERLTVVPADDGEHLLLELVRLGLPGRVTGVTAAHRVVEVVQHSSVQVDAGVGGHHHGQGCAGRVARSHPHRAHDVVGRRTDEIRHHVVALFDADVVGVAEEGEKSIRHGMERRKPLRVRVDRVGTLRRRPLPPVPVLDDPPVAIRNTAASTAART